MDDGNKNLLEAAKKEQKKQKMIATLKKDAYLIAFYFALSVFVGAAFTIGMNLGVHILHLF